MKNANGTSNRVTLLGNIGRDPEFHETQNGKIYCDLILATHGPREGETHWHNVRLWSGLAKLVSGGRLRKGDKLYVEGRLEYSLWTSPEGGDNVPVKIARVTAESINLLTRRERQEEPKRERTR